jgi:hypothetical protein
MCKVLFKSSVWVCYHGERASEKDERYTCDGFLQLL